jgi:hypothetical protein
MLHFPMWQEAETAEEGNSGDSEYEWTGRFA